MPDSPVFLKTLGAAQYRAGHYEDALATLLRSDEIRRRCGSSQPLDLAFLAMTYHQLGRVEEAHEILGRIDAPMRQRHPGSPAHDAWLEAERLILGSPSASDAAEQPPVSGKAGE